VQRSRIGAAQKDHCHHWPVLSAPAAINSLRRPAGQSELVCGTRRSAAALALRKNKAIWLFECGEDTQRQLMRQPLVRPGKVDRIFLSRATAECVLGLPGAASAACVPGAHSACHG